MGGLGKTTIVKSIYDELVEDHFPFYAWVTVSRSYKLGDVLKSMRRQLQKVAAMESDGLLVEDEALLIDELRKYLHQKRFMVVFDDVWQMELWTYIKSALPNNNKGSKIIITTRSEDVALTWRDSPSQGHIYKLQPLSAEKSWELFCKKAFQDSETEVLSNPEMEGLCHEIVKKCQGLPLAIVAIGGLLSTKTKTVSTWRKLLNSLSSELSHNPYLTDVTRILLLSYHDLDYYLKPCLLYFGLFPEDYHIDRMRLVRLWIAEGFVKRCKGKSMEEIAEEYLSELIRRSLVQVSTVNRLGKAKSFRVHDLLREIILLKSEELRFYQVVQGECSNAEGQMRRLAIHNIGLKRVEFESNLRSIFSFGNQGLQPNWLTGRFLKNIGLLKVLDLQDSQVTHLPEEVGNLHQLQYLSLRNSPIKKLPRSIGKLQNLLTLDLKQTLIEEIPVEVSKLKMLRHLLAYRCWDDPLGFFQTTRSVKIPKGVLDALQELQKLYVDGSRQGNLTEELRNLKQLKKLGITHLRIKDWADLCAAIENLVHLRTMMLTTINRNEILHLQFVDSPPSLLEKLYLKGALEKIPSWIIKLNSIVSIYLRWSRLKEDPMEVLKKVPNLEELLLIDAYEGENMQLSSDGFSKLKLLSIYEMKSLRSISIETGALPLLDRLSIGVAPQLKHMPFGIQNLTNLTRLTLIDTTEEFVHSELEGDGKKYTFEVYFHIKADGQWQIYTLR
ncbi:hypothetical protein V2J09_018333 [Rumex salicifolius]